MAQWLQGNLARSERASENLWKGFQAKFGAQKQLQDVLGNLSGMAFEGGQNELQRKLARQLPMIQSRAGFAGKQAERAQSAAEHGMPVTEDYGEFFRDEEPAPPKTAADILREKQGAPIIQEMHGIGGHKPGGEIPTKEFPSGETATSKIPATGKYPATIAQEVSGDPKNWRLLKFYDAGGNDVTRQVVADANAKPPKRIGPDVTVDVSGIPNLQQEYAVPPTGEQVGGGMEDYRTRLTELMSAKAPAEETAAVPRNRWAGLPEAEKRVENLTERYNSLKQSVGRDHPTWSQKQIDDEARTLYLGWYYGQGGGEDKNKDDGSRLIDYVMTVKEMAIKENRHLFNDDGTPKAGKEDEAYDSIADYAARYMTSAFKKGAFERNDLNAIFDQIVPNDMKSREPAKKYFIDILKNPNISREMSPKGDTGGGLWGTAYNWSPVKPIIWAVALKRLGQEEGVKLEKAIMEGNIPPWEYSNFVNKYLLDHGYKMMTESEKAQVNNAAKETEKQSGTQGVKSRLFSAWEGK